MAWTASVVQKGIVDKSFLVGISYTSGALQFVETLDMTGASLQYLSDRVSSRLATLESTQTLIPQVTLGAFTPTVAPATPLGTFLAALKHFNACQRAVTLGLMQVTDATYTSAQSAMQSAFDPSFIDSM